MKQIIIILVLCLTGQSMPHVQAAESTPHASQTVTVRTAVNNAKALSNIHNLYVTVKIRNTSGGSKRSARRFSSHRRALHLPEVSMAMAIVAIALAFRDYKAKDGKFIDIMVIEDSSQQPMHTDIEALLALYRFYLDLGQRAVFRLNVITGSRITSPKEAAIGNGAESIAQNAHGLFDLRFRQIEGFFNNVTGILAEHLESTGTAKPHKYNEVFRTIANDLNIFSTGTATEQIMLVHSSLREQSDLFSCTSDEDLGLLYSSPKEVAARFETAVKIGKLNRVKVIFVYAPIDEDDERFFLQMVDVYRYILTPLGAQVSIQSSAKTYGI